MLKSMRFNKGYMQQFGLDLKASGQSTWEFGSYDEKTYPFSKRSQANVVMSTWQIPWTNEEGQWMLEGGKCFINKKSDKKLACGYQVVVSTSTPLILMPSGVVNYYYSKVPGSVYQD